MFRVDRTDNGLAAVSLREHRQQGRVRKGGTVNFFGGCSSGTKVQLETNRLHYSEITLKATFHHTPETVRRAFGLIAAKKIRPTDYITGEAPLSRLSLPEQLPSRLGPARA